MYRTIESIVTNHQRAQARREAGKPIWDRQIKIKHLIGEDTTEEAAAGVANVIAKALRQQLPAKWLDTGPDMDFDLLEVVEGMESVSPDSYADDDDFTVLEDLNNMLGSLYDWADRQRVWIG